MEAPAMLLCFAIIMINAEGQTQLLDISINKTQLGGRKLEAHTPKQWPRNVQITRLAYKRCDYILYSWQQCYGGLSTKGVLTVLLLLLLLTAFA